MGKHIHKLVEKDSEALTGVCQNCGPTTLGKKGDRVYCNYAIAQRKAERAEFNKQFPARSNWPKEIRAKAHEMKLANGNVCPICLETYDKLVIDHSHSTGQFRGVLCHNCNIGLGQFRDSISALSRAIAYLNAPPALSH